MPGIDTEILNVCRLITSAATNLLEWEEDIRFTHVPSEFKELQSFLEGIAGAQLDEMMRIPSELTKIFEMENPKGLFEVQLVFKVPDNFVTDFNCIMERCCAAYLRRKGRI